MKGPAFHFVVALPAEAKPLIAHFGLQRQQPDGTFPLYQRDAITLVRSGVGRQAAAAATHFLLHRQPGRRAIWINLGIAGHATRPVGDMILAHRVRDDDSRQQWRIPSNHPFPCEAEPLTTLAQPDFHYDRAGAFDREAAGFLAALQGGGYCVKIISDNRHNPGRGLRAQQVSQLIRARLDTLDELMRQLGDSCN